MWILDLILLVLLGVLGIASWLKGRQPKLGGQLGPLEGVAGWVGLAGMVWGIVLLLRWISALGVFSIAPGSMLILLAVALVILSLSLILAASTLRSLFGSNGFTNSMSDLAGKLSPYKIGLGFACLVLALYTLLTVAGVRLF